MWNEIEADIKCTRGDCLHAAKQPGEDPCRACTCNRKTEAAVRRFCYEWRDLECLKSRTTSSDMRRS